MADKYAENLALAALGTIVAIGLVLTGGWRLIDKIRTTGTPPSIDAQLEDIRQAAARERRRIIYTNKMALHGTSSYVVVVGDRRLDPRRSKVDQGLVDNRSVSQGPNGETIYRENPLPPNAPDAESDELRIYDVAGKRVEQRLEFQPRVTRIGATTYAGGNGAYELHRLRSQDVDGDGRRELTGFYAHWLPQAAIPIPFIVDWDDEHGRYRLRALVPDRPAQGAARGVDSEQFNRSYRTPVTMADPKSDLTVTGYRVHAFTFFRGSGGIPRLLAGFVNGPTQLPKGWPLDVQGWRLNLGQEGDAFLQDCFPTRSIRVWEPPLLESAARPAEDRLRKVWRAQDALACG